MSASELPRELKIVAIPMFVMLMVAINALGKLPVVLSAYDAKGFYKNTWKVTGCYFLGGHLKFSKWQPSRFQNGCHFQHILAYISTSELPRRLKMVAISMFVILRIAIKVFGKLLVLFLLHLFWISKWLPLRFQNGHHFQLILAYISTSKLPR